MAARQDLIDKYGLTKPDSWDNYVSYLKELAEKQGETGVTALNTNANREQLLTVYGQSKGVQGVTEGYDFEYYANNSDAAPTTDDIWYLYTCILLIFTKITVMRWQNLHQQKFGLLMQ